MKRGEKRIKAYFERKSEVYEEVLDFLQSDEDIIIKFDNLCKLFSDQKVGNEPEELNHFLLMLLSISNNHHRKHGFFKKIEHILEFFKSDIKRTYSNFDLFKMFLSNKRILLFLFENDFIKFEEEFVKYFYDLPHYCHFFYPEIHEFISDEKSKLILEEMHEINPRYEEKFLSNRLEGENESYICSLIRTDSIDEFISHFHRTNFSLSMHIDESIFETNSLIKDKKPTLIEYCAFYGSIQIFNFLRMNNIDLEPTLWIYSIHSNNAEIIHILESNLVEPIDDTYEECLCEAIKCHHNEFVRYIKDNKYTPKPTTNLIIKEQLSFEERVISCCFKYYNYKNFPMRFNQKFIFYYLSKYDYMKIVKIFIKHKMIEINRMKIMKLNYFDRIHNHNFIKFICNQ